MLLRIVAGVCALALCTVTYGLTKGSAEDVSKYSDGPYLIDDHEKKSLIQHNIVEGDHIKASYQGPISPDFIYPVNRNDTFNNVSKIAAISDIHGQFDIFKQLLNENGVIDDELNWSFGDGHLVITGDIFDRGDTVTEALWLVYKLEEQANTAGGKVHYLLGNHEYMVLRGDERYIHDKYKYTLNAMNIDLKTLFNENTVLGRWLRSKSTVININGHVFLHGGIHSDFTDLDISLEQANNTFRQAIGQTRNSLKEQPLTKTLFGRTGPIWYRGYFLDPLLSQSDVETVLNKLQAKRIVVGHTSMDKVETRHNDKVIAIDTSIKKGKQGEILLIDFQQSAPSYTRGDMNGKQYMLMN
ncbi:MAG: metallophosphoesterase [Psychrobium sp.]